MQADHSGSRLTAVKAGWRTFLCVTPYGSKSSTIRSFKSASVRCASDQPHEIVVMGLDAAGAAIAAAKLRQTYCGAVG